MPSLPQPLEKDIQKAILDFLAYKKIFAWTNKTQGTYDPSKGIYRAGQTKKGVADILGVLPGGQFLAIEVKSAKGHLRPEQEEFLLDIKKAGGMAFMARSVEEVKSQLNF